MFLESILLFFPSFLGILIGFSIDRLWQKYQDGKDRKKLLDSFKVELKKCSELLVGEGNLCPLDMWKLSIATGLLKLLPFNTKEELSSIYFKLECHNYEAEKVRDVSIMSTMERGKPQNLVKIEPVMKNTPAEFKTYAEILHWQLSIRLRDSEKKLQKEIKNLLEKEIL